MTSTQPVLLHVLPVAGGEPSDLDTLVRSLTAAVAERDVGSISAVEPDEVPGEAKGLGALLGWIAVHISLRNLADLVQAAADWSSRNRRSVEIRYGDDALVLSNVTSAQQEMLIDEWIERHRGS